MRILEVVTTKNFPKLIKDFNSKIGDQIQIKIKFKLEANK